MSVPHPSKYLRSGVLLVVSCTYVAWSLRVAFLNFDSLSDLTLTSVLNEALRVAIFVGPVLIYLRYVEKAPVAAFLKMHRPREGTMRLLTLTGAAFVAWYLLLDNVLEDERIAGAAPPWSCSRSCPQQRW